MAAVTATSATAGGASASVSARGDAQDRCAHRSLRNSVPSTSVERVDQDRTTVSPTAFAFLGEFDIDNDDEDDDQIAIEWEGSVKSPMQSSISPGLRMNRPTDHEDGGDDDGSAFGFSNGSQIGRFVNVVK